MNPLLDALTEAGRQAGLTARHAISGVGGMASAFANPLALALNEGLELAGSDYRFPDQYAALQRAMTEAGLPEPQGALERGIGFGAEIGVPDPTDSAKVVSSLSHMIDPQWAMTVFHGSPHKWDRVDLTKVGTGEGAQAYGHGFYTAEQRGIAEDYQRKLTGRGAYTIDGEPVPEVAVAHWQGPLKAAAEGGDDGLRKYIAEVEGRFSGEDMPLEVLDELDAAENLLGKRVELATGHLYELDLPDETIEKMLDWDKPLSEQANADQLDELRNYFMVAHPSIYPNATGADLYRGLAKSFSDELERAEFSGDIVTEAMKRASAELKKRGFPGIKYLDGTSRSAGEGTRNFVVFDEQYIKPLTRNGEAIK